MKRYFLKSIIAAMFLGAVISSCSVATVTEVVEVEKQTLTYEYIMEGSNEMSVTLNVSEMLGEGVTIDDIEEASINSIIIKKNDSLGLSEINEAKVQLLGESEDLTMVTVAVSDSILATDKEIELTVLDETEIGDYLKEENVTVVLDLSYINDQDLEQDYDIYIKLNLEVREEKK